MFTIDRSESKMFTMLFWDVFSILIADIQKTAAYGSKVFMMSFLDTLSHFYWLLSFHELEELISGLHGFINLWLQGT